LQIGVEIAAGEMIKGLFCWIMLFLIVFVQP